MMWLCFGVALLLAYLLNVFHAPYLKLFRPSGEKYLTRWKLANNRLFRIYLHKLDGPDPDRHLHNHPWNAMVIILRGGYEQRELHLLSGTAWRTATTSVRWINRLGVYYHKITTIKPGTWTLVLGGPVHRHWGFLVEGKHVPWEDYVRDYQKGVLNAEGTVSGKAIGGR